MRLPGKTGRRFSRVWDVPARTGAVSELAEQLIESGIEKVTVFPTPEHLVSWAKLCPRTIQSELVKLFV